MARILRRIIPIAPIFFCFSGRFRRGLLVGRTFSVLAYRDACLFRYLTAVPSSSSFLKVTFGGGRHFSVGRLNFFFGRLGGSFRHVQSFFLVVRRGLLTGSLHRGRANQLVNGHVFLRVKEEFERRVFCPAFRMVCVGVQGN